MINKYGADEIWSMMKKRKCTKNVQNQNYDVVHLIKFSPPPEEGQRFA